MRKARRTLGFDALEGRIALSGATIVDTGGATVITTPSGNAKAHFDQNPPPQDHFHGAQHFDDGGAKVVVTASGNYNINDQGAA